MENISKKGTSTCLKWWKKFCNFNSEKRSFLSSLNEWVSIIILASGLFLAVFPHLVQECREHDFYVARLLFAIIIFPGAYWLFFSRTFRSIPSLFLSISITLLYIISLTFVTGSENYWGFKIEKATVLLQIKDSALFEWFGWSLLGSAVAAFVGEAAKSVWYNISGSTADENAKIGYRFKQQRRRLLSQGCCCDYLLVLGIMYSIFVTVIFILLCSIKVGEALDSLLRLFWAALSFGFAGFAMNFVITDEGLLKAESKYLKYRIYKVKRQTDKEGCRAKWQKANWLNYSQVLANSYASGSSLASVDAQVHKWPNFSTGKVASENDPCRGCAGKNCFDVIYMHCTLQKKYSITEADSSGHNRPTGPVDDKLCEIRFASRIFQALISNESPNKKKTPENFSITDVLSLSMNCYFHDEEAAWWRQSFSNVPISYDDLKSLLLLDVLKYLIGQYSEEPYCCLKWLCIPKNEDKMLSLAFLLEFPYIAMSCLMGRWKEALNADRGQPQSLFPGNHDQIAAAYYYHLFSEPLNAFSLNDAVEQLEQIAGLFRGYMINTNREQVCFDGLGPRHNHNKRLLELEKTWSNMGKTVNNTDRLLCANLLSKEESQMAMDTLETLSSDPYRYLTRIIFAAK